MIASPTSIYNNLCDAGLIAHRQVKQQLLTNENQKRQLIFAKMISQPRLEKHPHHQQEALPPLVPSQLPHNDVIWDKHGIEYYFEQKQYPPPNPCLGGGLLCHRVCNLVEYDGRVVPAGGEN